MIRRLVVPLQNVQYETIMREYERRQARNRRILEERREETARKLPRLTQIDEEVASLSTQKIRELFSGSSSDIQDLREKIEALSRERRKILTENGYPEDYLDMPYDCPICQDTGFAGNEKCACFKKAETALLYDQFGRQNILQEETFDHFSFDYYSDTIINEAAGISALETARRAYNTAKGFVEHFDTSFENLFFYGDTGVGKTFLSNCIANALIRSSHCVLYFSAFDLFDLMAGSTFSREPGAPDGERIYDCDLLIIDDLGTELTNSFVSSQLFLCINERILRKKSTVISTNLTLENFSDTYSERTFSRVASNYQMVKLVGKDIRLQKLFLGGK